MKNMTKRLRSAPSWRERAEIAKDKFPGTDFDHVFIRARAALQSQKLNQAGTRDRILTTLGGWLTNVILRGESWTITDLARALDTWKRNRPKPDPDLIVFCELIHMFPPGGQRIRLDQKTKRIVNAGKYPALTYGDLLAALDKHFPDHCEHRPRYEEAIRKKFKRYADLFGVKLANASKLKCQPTGHNQRKKV